MNELFIDLECVQAYIDDLLITSKGSFEEHLKHIEIVLTRLQAAGLKVCMSKSALCKDSLKYLGYWITREGIQPDTKKVHAILEISPPTKRKELKKFLGMVNYYRDMWPKRSEILAPLTALTSPDVPWKWEKKHQDAFTLMKRTIAKDTLLAFPNFSKPFTIHTDASKV